MTAYYQTELGWLRVDTQQQSVIGLVFVAEPGDSFPDRLCDAAAVQVKEYLSGIRRSFDFPLYPKGTDFERLVWQELMRIPYGQTVTYGEIARRIGRPEASRAVGAACAKNPIWLAIPCHRVVGIGSRLTGYAGGIWRKQALLELETRWN